MIVIKVELHSAITGKVTTLGRMHVINDGTATDPKKGNYDATVLRRGTRSGVTRQARVENWPREAKTIWHLIGRSLKLMGYAE